MPVNTRTLKRKYHFNDALFIIFNVLNLIYLFIYILTFFLFCFQTMLDNIKHSIVLLQIAKVRFFRFSICFYRMYIHRNFPVFCLLLFPNLSLVAFLFLTKCINATVSSSFARFITLMHYR